MPKPLYAKCRGLLAPKGTPVDPSTYCMDHPNRTVGTCDTLLSDFDLSWGSKKIDCSAVHAAATVLRDQTPLLYASCAFLSTPDPVDPVDYCTTRPQATLGTCDTLLSSLQLSWGTKKVACEHILLAGDAS